MLSFKFAALKSHQKFLPKTMYQQLLNKEQQLAVIGLGYVGLPIALAFAKKIKVIGFDINPQRVAMMREGKDPSNELEAEAFADCDIEFTNDLEVLKKARFFIVAVPTPVDEHNVPDLTPVLRASETLGKVVKKGDYVVYESTVYPGCTEEDCLPVIEEISGLKAGEDFKYGYSPERINPGDKVHTLQNVVKVTSGSDEEASQNIGDVYELVVTAGVHRASSVKVAEAAKIIENTQRDLNIALMNELSIIFDKMGINTHEVLAAAGTKWNFLRFYPGLVGGHCIGVDPYYLTYKAHQLGYQSRVILSGRDINDGMAAHVAKKLVMGMIKNKVNIIQAKVLVMGVTFKENVSDIRNSKVADLIKELCDYNVKVHIMDPYADNDELKHEYNLELKSYADSDYDAVIMAVNHDAYNDFDEAYFENIMKPEAILVDIKGSYRNKISNLKYWSL